MSDSLIEMYDRGFERDSIVWIAVTRENWLKISDRVTQLRQELSLAEEGLANYAQEVADLRQAYEYHKGNAERFKQRCWSLAVLLYPYDAPREAVAGDLGLPEPQSGLPSESVK